MTDKITDKQLLEMSKEQLLEIIEQGPAQAIWTMLRLQALARKMSGKKSDPSTPSSMIPPYEKENTQSDKAEKDGKKPDDRKKKKKPGRKKGHPGARRKTPPKVDETVEHKIETCPICGKPVQPGAAHRERIIEDIEPVEPVVTRHIIEGGYCVDCKKTVEPAVTEALPKAKIGNRTLATSAWLHYALGVSIGKVVEVFAELFSHRITAGGLFDMWKRAAGILTPWYDQIAEEARASATLNADETGWRVNGQTHWLWCFTNNHLTYFIIDQRRSGDVLLEFFREYFGGVLISDFFGAYGRLASYDRQACWAHLLREFKKHDDEKKTDEWKKFKKDIKQLYHDGIQLANDREKFEPAVYAQKTTAINRRLDALAYANYKDPDASRLAKRLAIHADSMFAFLDYPGVPPDNNAAEREIRGAVIARKTSFHNMSNLGADTQSKWMSIFQTLKKRVADPITVVYDALAEFISTGKLPSLPRAPDKNNEP